MTSVAANWLLSNYFRPVQRVSGAAGAPASCTPLKRTCPDYSTMLLNTAALSGFHQLQTPLLQSQLQQLPSRQIIQLPGAASYMSVTCTSHVVVTCTSHVVALAMFNLGALNSSLLQTSSRKYHVPSTSVTIAKAPTKSGTPVINTHSTPGNGMTSYKSNSALCM